MELKGQWCDQTDCRDFGKVHVGNIKVYSFVERRFYCLTCAHTFSADRGTFFETLRSEREPVLEILALLGERNSLRGLERAKHLSANTILHWLDLAGQHLLALSDTLIRAIRVSQAQVDELWSFVKKSRSTGKRTTHSNMAIHGFGERWPCRAVCAC